MPYKVVATQTLGNASTVITYWDGTQLSQKAYPRGYTSSGFIFPPPPGTDFATVPEISVSVPVGATVSRLEQTISAGGRVDSQTWQLSTGQDLVANYTYGPNSTTIPITVVRSSGDRLPVLTNFRTNTAGTQILFAVQNATLTKSVGTLTGKLAGVDFVRDLTFVSSGVVAIGGAALTNAATNLVINLTTYPTSRHLISEVVTNLVP